MALLLVGCAYVGQPEAPAERTTPAPTASSSATSSARPTDTPAPTATDFDAARREKARFVLERWAAEIAGLDEPIIFGHEVTRGGGWRGPDADEQKGAFLSGHVEAIEALSTETPAPGEVVWADGSRKEVQLVSAAEAFADMVRRHQWQGSPCDGCRTLKVTGAKLVNVEHGTARGPASVPAWQFQFVPDEKPTHPISHVALRDFINASDYEDWFEHGGGLGTAYGHPSDRRLTVTFAGSPCVEGSRFYGEVIETDIAITVLIHYRPRGDEPSTCRAMAVGYQVTVELAEPLGDRYVLDSDSGFPVTVLAEEPPPDR